MFHYRNHQKFEQKGKIFYILESTLELYIILIFILTRRGTPPS